MTKGKEMTEGVNEGKDGKILFKSDRDSNERHHTVLGLCPSTVLGDRPGRSWRVIGRHEKVVS